MSAPAFGHLFAGIDGFGLGLGAVGYRTAWAIEVADFPREVLAARLPGVEVMGDIREVERPPKVAGLSGGFPCQDLSDAGLRAGITGARSGLWGEYARLIGEVEPDVVVVENVPALLRRGFDIVVRDLVGLGYRVEWDCIPAAAFGAPHLRDRVWVVAHRHPAPVVFGEPEALLFPVTPPDLSNGWRRWPRAGWVDGDPDAVIPLAPLAPLAAVRGGSVLPTPTVHEGPNSGGNVQQWGGLNSLTALAREGELHKFAELLPTPVARDWKGAGLDGQLGTVAARGLWPTVVASDSFGSRRSTARTDAWESNDGETLLDAVSDAEGIRWPTPHGMPKDGQERNPGPSGNELGRAVNEAELELFPTPKSSPSGPDFARAGREGSGGDDLATYIARQERLPTPRATDGDKRNRGDLVAHAKERPNAHHDGDRPDGRENERRKGALNPEWVEWLMGFPLGWTDVAVANSDLRPWPWQDGEPPGVPRVTGENNRRNERLTALGNALIPQAPAWLGARIARLFENATTTGGP